MNAEHGEPMQESGTEPESPQQEARTCPVCGTKLSAAGGSDFCPVCILRGAPAGASAATGESGSASESAASPGDTDGTPQVRRFEHYEVMVDEDGRPIELGRGAMGITYKALDVDLRCPVTLKVISERYLGDESAQLRFLREARAAAIIPGASKPDRIAEDIAALKVKEPDDFWHEVRMQGLVAPNAPLPIDR